MTYSSVLVQFVCGVTLDMEPFACICRLHNTTRAKKKMHTKQSIIGYRLEREHHLAIMCRTSQAKRAIFNRTRDDERREIISINRLYKNQKPHSIKML